MLNQLHHPGTPHSLRFLKNHCIEMVIIFIIKGQGFAPLQFCAQGKYLTYLLLAFLDLDSEFCLKAP